jgi:predicted adenylyl cyclase CyaB
MNRNIEIKAHLRDPKAVAAKAAVLSGTPPQVLDQEDTFFQVPTGRLKLRVFSPEEGELISYHRPDATGPKLSQYAIHPTATPDLLRTVLTATLETLGVVRKRRLVYLVGQTRVHLDHVDGLGHFLELEVVLTPDQTNEEGEEQARHLLATLDIPESDLISGAYLDLLRARVSQLE